MTFWLEADEPEAEVVEEKKTSFFSLASVKSKMAGLVCTKEDIWKQVQFPWCFDVLPLDIILRL